MTQEGQHLSVIAHRDGSRSLNVYRRDDPDACALSLHFTGQEAAVLADALSSGQHDSRLLHGTDLGPGSRTDSVVGYLAMERAPAR